MNNLGLIIDTSLHGVALGVASLDTKEFLYLEHFAKNSGSGLSLLVTQALEQLHLASDEVRFVVVSHGPGSFTGIRVGLSWIYGFVSGTEGGLPILGLSSLEQAAVALAKKEKRDSCLFFPNTFTHGYIALSTVRGSTELKLVTAAEAFLDDTADTALYFVTDALKCDFSNKIFSRGHSISSHELATTALHGLWQKTLTALPYTQWQSKLPEPFYLRNSSAEEKRSMNR